MRELKPSSGYVCKNTKSKNGKRLGRPPGSKNRRKVNKRKKGTAPPKKPAKRGPGNHQSQAPITPTVSRRIAKLWLIGTNLSEISEAVSVHKSAVARHVDRHLAPVFRDSLRSEAIRVASLLREASKVSWQRVLEDRSDSDSLKLFCWACDNLLSISGAHSPIRIDVGNEYRIAGSGKEQLENSMLTRLAAKIEDLRSSTASTVDADEYLTLEE